MPRRNRVTPFGDIIAVEARGLLYGNRGVLHDDRGELVRAWQVRRWLACLLEFKGRRRPLMRPGRFTELFFLDEATALAAGHRPCAECRRGDYRRFCEAWSASHPGSGRVRADDLDRMLHHERLDLGGSKRLHRARLRDLPEGAMITENGRAWLVQGDDLVAWSPSGYTERRSRSRTGTVSVLTPPSTIDVIRAGFRPMLHPSATDG